MSWLPPSVSRHLMWTCANMPPPPCWLQRAVSEHGVGLWVKSNYSSDTRVKRECACLGSDSGKSSSVGPETGPALASLSLPVGSADRTCAVVLWVPGAQGGCAWLGCSSGQAGRGPGVRTPSLYRSFTL